MIIDRRTAVIGIFIVMVLTLAVVSYGYDTFATPTEIEPFQIVSFPDESFFASPTDAESLDLISDIKMLSHLSFLVLCLSFGALLYLCFRRKF